MPIIIRHVEMSKELALAIAQRLKSLQTDNKAAYQALMGAVENNENLLCASDVIKQVVRNNGDDTLVDSNYRPTREAAAITLEAARRKCDPVALVRGA